MTSGNEMIPAPPLRRRVPASTADSPAPARRVPPAKPIEVRWSRRRGVMGVFAAVAALAFAVAWAGPMTLPLVQEAKADEIEPISLYANSLGDVQSLEVDASEATVATFDRPTYEIYVKPKPTPTPTVQRTSTSSGTGWRPPFVTPDPGTAQAIAYDMVLARGWGDDQFACLVALWNKESGWRVNAYNRSSGAYGIPQALPGSKMATAGADWETNPATQIAWGLGYVGGRYGTPCGAWDHSQRVGWY